MPLLVEVCNSAGKWQTVEVDVGLDHTVAQVKECLARVSDVPVHLQLLSAGDRLFTSDSETLDGLGLHGEDCLHLTDYLPLRSPWGAMAPREAITEIAETEHRGITLSQLQDLVRFVDSRCASSGVIRGWYDLRTPGSKKGLVRQAINLYEVNAWVIKPATSKPRCSYIELVAVEPEAQRPSWFVSHAWSEPVLSFVRCVEEHSRLRHLPSSTAWWVCAYANNQHQLGADLVRDPHKTSFYRALLPCVGVLLMLDEQGSTFTRIWCCFEQYLALSSSSLREERMLLDIALDVGGSAEFITDGACAEDLLMKQKGLYRNINGYEFSIKANREATFPIQVVQKALTVIDVMRAQASHEVDKRRILNAIVGRTGDALDDAPLLEHPKYEETNAALRAIFALAALPGCAKQGLLPELRHIAGILEKDSAERDSLPLYFSDLKEFNDEHLAAVAAALPPKLQDLTVTLTRCQGVTNKGAVALSRKLPQHLQRLMLSFHATKISDAGLVALAENLPPSLRYLFLELGNCSLSDEGLKPLAQRLPVTLEALTLNAECCEEFCQAVVSLGTALPPSLRKLHLNFMGCHCIGDAALTALAEGLSSRMRSISLILFGTAILDAGVASLTWHLHEGLQSLSLDLRATGATEASIATLGANLPSTLVDLQVQFSSDEGNETLTREELLGWCTAHPEVAALPRPALVTPSSSPRPPASASSTGHDAGSSQRISGKAAATVPNEAPVSASASKQRRAKAKPKAKPKPKVAEPSSRAARPLVGAAGIALRRPGPHWMPAP